MRPVSPFHFEGASGTWESMGLLNRAVSGLLMGLWRTPMCSAQSEALRVPLASGATLGVRPPGLGTSALVSRWSLGGA